MSCIPLVVGVKRGTHPRGKHEGGKTSQILDVSLLLAAIINGYSYCKTCSHSFLLYVQITVHFLLSVILVIFDIEKCGSDKFDCTGWSTGKGKQWKKT